MKHLYQLKLLFILTMTALLGLAACSPTTGSSTQQDENPPVDQDGADAGEETAVPSTDDSSESAQTIPAHIWILQSYDGQSVMPNTTITAQWREDGQLNGSAGCNDYFGSYQLEGSTLSISQVGSTEKFCEGMMEQESAFINSLTQAQSWSMQDDGTLTVNTAVGDLLFTKAVDAALSGNRWQLNGIVETESEAVVSYAVDSDIWMKFEDGMVSGSAGCNTFSGSYTDEDGSLTLGPLMTTLMACEDERGEREAQFLDALSQVSAYQIEMERLTLLDAEGNEVMILNAADQDQPVITIERTPCFGFCPTYQVEIFADGTVHYNGISFVEVEGEQTSQVDPAEVMALLDKMVAAGYLTWEDAYTERRVTDMPSTITSITVDGVTKRIERYGGDDSAPEALIALENEIDALVNVSQWTGLESETAVPETVPPASDQYIVTLKIDLASAGGDAETAAAALNATAEEIVATTSGEMVRTLDIINGFVVRGLSEADVAALRKNPNILSVEPDRIITLDPIEMEGAEVSVEKTIFVGPERVDCEGVGPQKCYLVKEQPNDDWTLFYGEIEEFTWEPGYEYELKILETQVDNPPADGSSIVWSLLGVISQTAVNE